MSEHMMPIPARVYNSAVGGHVCGPEDIDFGQKVVHLVKYDRAGNEVSFESQVTQANKIYVIHDDFVLSSNVTIPANCVLKFDGGSISGAYTISINDCYIIGSKEFLNCSIAGNIKNEHIYVEWFGGSDYDKISKAFALSSSTVRTTSGDEGNASNKAYKIIVFEGRVYKVSQTCQLPNHCYIKGNKAVINNTANAKTFEGTSYFAHIENIAFKGIGGSAIYINTGNLDSSFIEIDNIEFNTRNLLETSPALYLHSRSANIRVTNSKFVSCPRALDIDSDMASVDNCWFNFYADVSNYRIPANTWCINNNGCINLMITNCIFVPEGDGNRNPNVRYIDHKAGHLTIYNCRFGGENSGAPIIWLYPNAISTAVHDSFVTVGPNWLGESGLIVLMDGVVPKNINLNGLQDLNGPIFSAYGYIKDNGIIYSTEIEKAQAGWDAFEDYIKGNNNYPTDIFIDSMPYKAINPYSLYPFCIKKTRLGNPNFDTAYNIGRLIYTYSVGSIEAKGSLSAKIKTTINVSYTSFNAIKEYIFDVNAILVYDVTNVQASLNSSNEVVNENTHHVDDFINVTLTAIKDATSTNIRQIFDLYLTIGEVSLSVLGPIIDIELLDSNLTLSKTQNGIFTLLPLKCPVNY